MPALFVFDELRTACSGKYVPGDPERPPILLLLARHTNRLIPSSLKGVQVVSNMCECPVLKLYLFRMSWASKFKCHGADLGDRNVVIQVHGSALISAARMLPRLNSSCTSESHISIVG